MVQLTPVLSGSRVARTTRGSAMPHIGGMRSVPTTGGQLVDISVDTFFTSKRVVASLDPARRRALSKAGFETRRIAQQSMVLRPLAVHSPAGQPPHSHKHYLAGSRKLNRGTSQGLRKSIMYGYDFTRKTVVVGPSTVRGHNIANIAPKHEHGRSGRSVHNPQRTVREMGRPGEIRIGPPFSASTKQVKVGTFSQTYRHRKTVRVTYAPLTTPRMVQRANEINQDIYGPDVLSGRYAKRPAMVPAMLRIVPMMPMYWRNALSA